MFRGWENFYLIVGPSAGALIGLMFVVVTLTAGRERDETERGKHLYTSPIVWHLAVVLLLSGAAVAPAVSPKLFGLLTGAVALLGILLGVRSTVGIARGQLRDLRTACSISGGTGSSRPPFTLAWPELRSRYSPVRPGAPMPLRLR